MLWLHGGGFVMGDLETEHPWALRIAQAAGTVVISVGYRRAPEHRFPAALDDAWAVLGWTADHAAELGIDRDRLAVGGHAAGAGLAAAVALRARDQQGPSISFQLLNQPQLDDPQSTWSAREFTDTPFMTRDKVSVLVAALPGLRARLRLRRARRGPAISPACPRPTSRPPSSTRTATRPSSTRCGCSRRACRSSCTSGPAHSTAHRRSCPPRCRSARWPSSPLPCVAASPPDPDVPSRPPRGAGSHQGVTRVHCAAVADHGPVPHPSSLPPPARQAVRVMTVGVALGLVALAAPLVDQLTAGGLAAHLGSVYAGTGVAAPAASMIAAYLVGLGVLGVLAWGLTIRVVRRRGRRAPLLADAFLVVGAALAAVDLTVTEYGGPILPTWLGVLGLLPCVPGLVAVVLLHRRTSAGAAPRVA